MKHNSNLRVGYRRHNLFIIKYSTRKSIFNWNAYYNHIGRVMQIYVEKISASNQFVHMFRRDRVINPHKMVMPMPHEPF